MENKDINISETEIVQSLTKQQKKNKKKREAAKKKKQDQKDLIKKDTIQETSPEQTVAANNSLETDVIDNFEEELCWCIQQIQLGLQTQKPTKDQVVKSNKLVEQLKSKKTPMPKKRMLMRTNFGDYREKMKKERKQLNRVIPAKFVDVNEKVINKSTFFRKKMSDMPPSSSSPNQEEFRFNFSDLT